MPEAIKTLVEIESSKWFPNPRRICRRAFADEKEFLLFQKAADEPLVLKYIQKKPMT